MSKKMTGWRWGLGMAMMACGLGACSQAEAQPSAQSSGDARAGAIKADTCMGCHGVAGTFNVYPSYRVPKLGGQNPGYIAEALRQYRAGQRPHGTMHAQASSLSDQDITDIAAFLSQGDGS